MLSFGIFGITNDSLNQAVSVLILVLIVIWAALVFWTYADARRRIDDPMLVGCATAASLFPFVGTIVYLIVRPPEFVDDVRLRELEMTAAEARLAQLDYQLCPHCDYEIKADYLRCPSCQRKLKERCFSCSKPVDPAWKVCPYCEAEMETPPPPQATRRRRRSTTTDQPTVAAEAIAVERTDGEREAKRDRRRERPYRRRKDQRGPDPDPGQAGRVRARPDRRDHRPLRAQGPEDRRPPAHDHDRGDGEAPLRRARGQAVLRRARRVHRLRAAGGDGARG